VNAMIKQDWMVIVAGEALVDQLTKETLALKSRESETLCRLQINQAGRGILGVELVHSWYGYSVRYDSGLQDWGLLASSRHKQLDGTLEDAVRWATAWVAEDPNRRYAWYRKGAVS